MAKTQIKNYVFKPGIGILDNLFPNAYSLLEANKTFIQKEATAWIQDQIDASAAGFVGYTYNQSKCERDVGYVIDAYLNDLRYGGNEKLRNTIKYYWDQDVAQVDGDRQPEILTHTFIGTLIKDYIFTNTAYSASNTSVTQTINESLTAEAVTYTPTNAVYTPTTGEMVLTITGHNLTVGSSIVIAPGSLTFTCALDGNATNHSYPRASGVPNTTGRDPFYKTALTVSAVTTNTITVNVGISSDTSVHTFVSASSGAISASADDIIDTFVFATVDVITNGLSNLPTVVSTGVGTIKIQGRHNTDELLLITNTTDNTIVYNFSNNSTGGEVTLKTDGISTDPDFPKYLQTTDAITTIRLNYDTRNMSSTDELQIFVEKIENGKSVVTTRPYDFGTDAIERMRVAPALSMLDADFEYGLQPTKWAAIGTLRGYPSVYEIPGTDTEVIAVRTDASLSEGSRIFEFTVTNNGTSDWSVTGTDRNGVVSGNDPTITILEGDTVRFTNNATATHPFYIKTTNSPGAGDLASFVSNNGAFGGGVIEWTPIIGDATTYYYMCSTHAVMQGQLIVQSNNNGDGVGQSLITVTTVGPHGFSQGTPITIKALEDAVLGAARAEGSFVIDSVPNANAFTYYAKSKVGTTYNTTLSTGYTQLREAGFYTGASIGNPSWTIASNGSAGTMTTQLGVLSGSTIIPFDGPAPEIGSPLTTGGGQIPAGSQVTTINDTSAGGGTYITPTLINDEIVGSTSVTVQSAAGIVENLSVDRGDGFAINISSIVGNTLNFDREFISPVISNLKSYFGVSGTNENSIGSLATFDITSNSGAPDNYTLVIANGGEAYEIGDRIIISGDDLGGFSPENDALIIVESIGSGNAITSATISGTPFNGTTTLTGLSATYAGGTGTGAGFDVTYVNGNYINVDVSSPDSSSGYAVNDIIVLPGSAVNPTSGIDGTHDVYVTVTGVGLGGAVTSVTYAGTAPQAYRQYFGVAYTYVGAIGTGAVFNVEVTGNSYVIEVANGGLNYAGTETFTIDGSVLGGVSGTHDLTITVASVDGSGTIQTVTRSGTAYNGDQVQAIGGTNRVGADATFDVEITGSAYNVTVNNPGTGYGNSQELTIAGTSLGGTSPTNDLTITLTINDIRDGVIFGVSTSGTAIGASYGTYNGVSGTNQAPVGVGATFNLGRNFYLYESLVIATGGSDYKIGNRIIISGEDLDGTAGLNDIVIRVTAISGGGDSGPITGFDFSYIEANPGTNFDLISSVVMTEATTGNIGVGLGIDYEAVATLEIDFENAHGLVPGDTFIVTVTTDDGTNNHNLASGAFFATEIPSVTSLRYTARSAGTIDVSTTDLEAIIYPRPDSFFIHRPYDGGVQLGTGGPQHGAQAIRQSKKYIRYQSGKGIMYTTGALFAPSYDLRSLTAEDVEVGSLITVVTDDNDHGVQVGGVIRILGVETPGYNSGPETATPPEFDYTVVEVDDERTFKIRAQRRLGATDAVLGFGAQMSVVSWHGATVRSGIFDDQNGIFWEYDGTQISVNQRTGTRQLAGTIAMSVDTNLVTGTNTRFRDQLKAGDRIIIKGMTHVVSHVNSQTECTVTPDWRGVTDITGTKANLIVDKKVKQSEFNLDRLDGTGPSGYDIDIAKMQMIGIQYSWYGAGFIDFMLRGQDGNFIFAHRMRNSNVNTEAFMRSGNLPVRYEVTNEGPAGKLRESMSNSQTFVPLIDSSFFPDSGTVYIDNEIINFNGNDKTSNNLTGCTRSATFSNFQAGATRSYTAGSAASHDDRTGVVLISQTITPLISHWGSAFLTDGGFDEDRGYIFSYAATGVEVSTTKTTSFLIRLAPSVSNALVGDLGERELLNRAQLLLQSLEVTSDGEDGAGNIIQGGIVIEGVLNPQNYPLNPADVSWSGLSNKAQGGQPSFAQIAPGGAVDWGATTATATATVSADIDTGYIYNPYYGANENNSPIEFTTSEYLTRGPVLSGSLIYGGDGVSTNNVYTDGGRGDYYVTGVRFGLIDDGVNGYNIDFRSTTGRTQRANNWPATRLIRFVYRTYTGRTSRLLFTKSSWESSGATLGTPVSVSDTNWPAGTAVSNVSLLQLGSTEFYEVTFNQTSTGNITNGDTVTFEFGAAAFAEPGETIFSFIATPGERATVDFSELKELTNTPLGGRGTYPNGPDVLAINVFKVSGTATTANIILKWGEAQA